MEEYLLKNPDNSEETLPVFIISPYGVKSMGGDGSISEVTHSLAVYNPLHNGLCVIEAFGEKKMKLRKTISTRFKKDTDYWEYSRDNLVEGMDNARKKFFDDHEFQFGVCADKFKEYANSCPSTEIFFIAERYLITCSVAFYCQPTWINIEMSYVPWEELDSISFSLNPVALDEDDLRYYYSNDEVKDIDDDDEDDDLDVRNLHTKKKRIIGNLGSNRFLETCDGCGKNSNCVKNDQMGNVPQLCNLLGLKNGSDTAMLCTNCNGLCVYYCEGKKLTKSQISYVHNIRKNKNISHVLGNYTFTKMSDFTAMINSNRRLFHEDYDTRQTRYFQTLDGILEFLDFLVCGHCKEGKLVICEITPVGFYFRVVFSCSNINCRIKHVLKNSEKNVFWDGSEDKYWYDINVLGVTSWNICFSDFPKFYKFFSLMNVLSPEKNCFYELSLPLHSVSIDAAEKSVSNAWVSLQKATLQNLLFLICDCFDDVDLWLCNDILKIIFEFLFDKFYTQFFFDLSYDSRRRAKNGIGVAVSKIINKIIGYVVVSQKRRKKRKIPYPTQRNFLETAVNSSYFEQRANRCITYQILERKVFIGNGGVGVSSIGKDGDLKSEDQIRSIISDKTQDLPLTIDLCTTHGKKNVKKKLGEGVAINIFHFLKEYKRQPVILYTAILATPLHRKKIHIFCTDDCKYKFDLSKWDFEMAFFDSARDVALFLKQAKYLNRHAKDAEKYYYSLDISKNESIHAKFWRNFPKGKDFIYLPEKGALSVALDNDGIGNTAVFIFDRIGLDVSNRSIERLRKFDRITMRENLKKNDKKYKRGLIERDKEFRLKLKEESELELRELDLCLKYPNEKEKEQIEEGVEGKDFGKSGAHHENKEIERILKLKESLRKKLEKDRTSRCSIPENAQDLDPKFFQELEDNNKVWKDYFVLVCKLLEIKSGGNKPQLLKRIKEHFGINDCVDNADEQNADMMDEGKGLDFIEIFKNTASFDQTLEKQFENEVTNQITKFKNAGKSVGGGKCLGCEKKASQILKCASCATPCCGKCSLRRKYFVIYDPNDEDKNVNCFRCLKFDIIRHCRLAFTGNQFKTFYGPKSVDRCYSEPRCSECEVPIISGLRNKMLSDIGERAYCFSYCVSQPCRKVFCGKCSIDQQLFFSDEKLYVSMIETDPGMVKLIRVCADYYLDYDLRSMKLVSVEQIMESYELSVNLSSYHYSRKIQLLGFCGSCFKIFCGKFSNRIKKLKKKKLEDKSLESGNTVSSDQ